MKRVDHGRPLLPGFTGFLRKGEIKDRKEDLSANSETGIKAASGWPLGRRAVSCLSNSETGERKGYY